VTNVRRSRQPNGRVRLVEKLRDRRFVRAPLCGRPCAGNAAAESYLSKWIAAKRTAGVGVTIAQEDTKLRRLAERTRVIQNHDLDAPVDARRPRCRSGGRTIRAVAGDRKARLRNAVARTEQIEDLLAACHRKFPVAAEATIVYGNRVCIADERTSFGSSRRTSAICAIVGKAWGLTVSSPEEKRITCGRLMTRPRVRVWVLARASLRRSWARNQICARQLGFGVPDNRWTGTTVCARGTSRLLAAATTKKIKRMVSTSA